MLLALPGCGDSAVPVIPDPVTQPEDDAVTAKVNDGTSDSELIQGQWNLVRSVRSGQEIPAEQLAGSVFRFTGDRWIPGRDENDYSTFVLQPDASPSQIDITDRDGNQMLGVYQLDGDSLTLCLSRPGNDRPSQLVSDAACNCFLIGLER